MKRIICLLLALTLLWGCAAVPQQTPETLPTVPEVSDQPTVVYPQKGEYRETVLLANVSDQNRPLLLDIREDGSVDYIYSEGTSLSDGSVRHYVISPDGTAQLQDDGWLAQLEDYTAQVTQAAALENGHWRYLLTAEDGLILILAQFHDIVSTVKNSGNFENSGEIRHTALFKLENGVLSKIPMDFGPQKLDLLYISSITLENGQIGIQVSASPYVEYRNWYFRYGQDGVLLEHQELPVSEDYWSPYALVDDDGLILYSAVLPNEAPPEYLAYRSMYERSGVTISPEEKTYTEDDSLYLLGRKLQNLELTACGADGTIYCWFRELRGGVLMQYAPDPAGRTEPEVATIWSLEPIGLIETAVAQWNATHASPIFRYETAQGDQAEALDRLRLELANGKGPDVLILDGCYTPGLLDFMIPLDRLDLSGVYENLLEPFTLNGDLLALPVRMEPYLLGRDPDNSREIGSLAEFTRIVTEARELEIGAYGTDARSLDALYNISDCAQLFDLWYPAWADAIWKDGKYHSDVFRELLDNLKRLTDHYRLDAPVWDEPLLNATDGPMYGNLSNYVFPYILSATSHVGLYAYWWYDQPTQSCILAGIPGPDGTGAAAARVIAGVRDGGMESAGLAFLQLLLTEEMQVGAGYFDPAQADGYPVKWSCTELLLDRMANYMGQPFTTENDYHTVLTGLRGVALDNTLYQASKAAAIACLRQPPNDFELQSGLSWETLTLDEAVERLEENTRLYLAEGN